MRPASETPDNHSVRVGAVLPGVERPVECIYENARVNGTVETSNGVAIRPVDNIGGTRPANYCE